MIKNYEDEMKQKKIIINAIQTLMETNKTNIIKLPLNKGDIEKFYIIINKHGISYTSKHGLEYKIKTFNNDSKLSDFELFCISFIDLCYVQNFIQERIDNTKKKLIKKIYNLLDLLDNSNVKLPFDMYIDIDNDGTNHIHIFNYPVNLNELYNHELYTIVNSLM